MSGNAVKKITSAASPSPLESWEQFSVTNAAPEWVKALRLRGRDMVLTQGLPNTGWERYKYTDVSSGLKSLIETTQYQDTHLGLSGDTRFTTLLRTQLNEMPAWARTFLESPIVGMAQYRDTVLWGLTNAFLRDGLIVDVPADTELEPLAVTLTGQDGAMTCPHSLIRLGKRSRHTIVETHAGQGVYWNNRVTQIHVEQGAHLRHYRIQTNSDQSAYTQHTQVILERDATYEAFVLTMGAGLSRNQIHVELKGENAEVRLAGANLLRGSQHGDTTITIEHQAPHCRSNQTYKTILADKAHGVFQGKVHVHQVAQKTDGYQLSNTLLLSPQAVMDTKPELEIYADDVKCSHGATTGQLDMAPLFYLRSRGLNEAQAKFLLMQAYLGPALEEIRDDTVRDQITTLATTWLEQVSG